MSALYRCSSSQLAIVALFVGAAFAGAALWLDARVPPGNRLPLILGLAGALVVVALLYKGSCLLRRERQRSIDETTETRNSVR